MKKENCGASSEIADRLFSHSFIFCSGNHKSSCIDLTEASDFSPNEHREVNIPFVNEWTIILKD
jgi:UDP-N-acetyl-D-mannosaminuronate dehydrogenase